ncbi:MAG: hypothetical protein QXO70_02835 [Candidatus Pacearchaeota archaeon]
MKQCKCGTTRNSPDAVPVFEYSFGGMIKLLFGLTATPKYYKFQCKKCGEFFDELSEAELKNFRY